MIKIEFDGYGEPAAETEPERKRLSRLWKAWRADCEAKTQEMTDAVDAGTDPKEIKIDRKLYSRDTIKELHFMAKDGPFQGKCVYCESFITDFQRGDIEHFRPKGAVTDSDDNPIRITDRSGAERDHWGYYWLAYDETNLMPTCQLCNQPSGEKIGKWARFPVTGTYAKYHDDDLTSERPALINPLTDDPSRHLEVDPDTGQISAKILKNSDTGEILSDPISGEPMRSQRGLTCIKILGLKERDQLTSKRLSAANNIKRLWGKLAEIESREAAKKELREILAGGGEQVLASRCMYKKLVDELNDIGR